MKNDSLKEQYRINERIRVREVRLVGDNVEQGVYPTSQALKMAEDQGLDLVEISPNAAPPVCRITDYQKFLYQQKKRQKEQKAKNGFKGMGARMLSIYSAKSFSGLSETQNTASILSRRSPFQTG